MLSSALETLREGSWIVVTPANILDMSECKELCRDNSMSFKSVRDAGWKVTGKSSSDGVEGG